MSCNYTKPEINKIQIFLFEQFQRLKYHFFNILYRLSRNNGKCAIILLQMYLDFKINLKDILLTLSFFLTHQNPHINLIVNN